MDAIPTELVAEIFELACTDSGQTGRSLSLVSTYFHDIVQPIQLQCIALSGLKQMQEFLKLLVCKPKKLRRVKHLYIADRPEDFPKRSSGEYPTHFGTELHSARNSQREYNSNIMHCIISILKLTSTTLQTLSIFLRYHEQLRHFHDFPGIIPTDLPSLVELSIYANITKQSFAESFVAPKVERMHIGNYTSLPDDVTGAISRVAPRLTHLRISGVSAWVRNGNLLDVVRDVAVSSTLTSTSTSPSSSSSSSSLSTSTSTSTSAASMYPTLQETFPSLSLPPQPSFPPTLRKIIIGQRVSYVTGTRGNPAYHSHTVGALERSGMMCKNGRLVVLQIPPFMDAPGYWEAAREGREEESRREWEERVGGGVGGWDPAREWVCVVPDVWGGVWFGDRR